MSYARPNYDAAYATFAGLDAYSRPDHDNAWATWAAPAEDVVVYVGAASPLGAPQIVVSVSAAGTITAPSVLQPPQLLGEQPPFGFLAVASPLDDAPALLLLHDFTGAPVGNDPARFRVYLRTGSGDVRVAASSCQGTLQLGESGYLQAVLPNAGVYLDSIEAATSFYVARVGMFGGVEVETPLAEAPVANVSLAQGPFNYSATISGATEAMPQPPQPLPAAYERALRNVRTLFLTDGSRRARCDIDWLMRPGFTATLVASSFSVDYLNFYLSTEGDVFMDVGDRP